MSEWCYVMCIHCVYNILVGRYLGLILFHSLLNLNRSENIQCFVQSQVSETCIPYKLITCKNCSITLLTSFTSFVNASCSHSSCRPQNSGPPSYFFFTVILFQMDSEASKQLSWGLSNINRYLSLKSHSAIQTAIHPSIYPPINYGAPQHTPFMCFSRYTKMKTCLLSSGYKLTSGDEKGRR